MKKSEDPPWTFYEYTEYEIKAILIEHLQREELNWIQRLLGHKIEIRDWGVSVIGGKIGFTLKHREYE